MGPGGDTEFVPHRPGEAPQIPSFRCRGSFTEWMARRSSSSSDACTTARSCEPAIMAMELALASPGTLAAAGISPTPEASCTATSSRATFGIPGWRGQGRRLWAGDRIGPVPPYLEEITSPEVNDLSRTGSVFLLWKIDIDPAGCLVHVNTSKVGVGRCGSSTLRLSSPLPGSSS